MYVWGSTFTVLPAPKLSLKTYTFSPGTLVLYSSSIVGVKQNNLCCQEVEPDALVYEGE